VPESMALTCPQHDAVLIPSPVQAGMLMCPDATCATVVCLSAGGPPSPMTFLEQGAAERHELVCAHERAGFSRSEAMQVLCTTITASIMKDRGHG
jgi:hypothetical protein